MEFRFDAPNSLAASLLEALKLGEIVDFSNGRPIYKIEKALVGRFNGLKLEVYSKEHPPPHFHVRVNNESAAFCISSCHRQKGHLGLKNMDKTIHHWWSQHKDEIISAWDCSRPTDCPVGPYADGCNCEK